MRAPLGHACEGLRSQSRSWKVRNRSSRSPTTKPARPVSHTPPPPQPQQPKKMKPPQPPLLHLLLLMLLLVPASAFLSFPKPPTAAATTRLDARRSASPLTPKLTFRQGLPADAPLIRQSMQEARMNPTFLNPANFIVAEQNDQGKGKEKETGLTVAGFGQVRPVAGANERVWELASVYVLPSARGQGVGSQIVAKLVQDFGCDISSKAASPRRLVLLTLADTASFYTPHGLSVLPDPVCAEPRLPLLLVLEFLAGSVVARLSIGPGTKLVVMELLLPEEGGRGGGASRRR